MFLEKVAGEADVPVEVVSTAGGVIVVGSILVTGWENVVGVDGAIPLEADELVAAGVLLAVYNTTSLPEGSREPGCGS